MKFGSTLDEEEINMFIQERTTIKKEKEEVSIEDKFKVKEKAENKEKKTKSKISQEKAQKKDSIESIQKLEPKINLIVEEDEEFHENLGQIVQGAKFTIYKIFDRRTKKLICKKVFTIDSKDENIFKQLKRTLKENDVLSCLEHPCICQLEGNEDMTTVALFLEFLEYKIIDVLSILNNTLKIIMLN